MPWSPSNRNRKKRVDFTWPRKPVVPLSTNGTPDAKQRRFTCRLASRLSRPLSTTLNCLKKSTLKSGSLTFAWYGVILIWGLNFRTASLATWRKFWVHYLGTKSVWKWNPEKRNWCDFLTLALDCPTCFCRNKNCLFKLLTSIVSMSIWK